MRWGNVAQLVALVVAVVLIAFGVPDGCGSEPEAIPLDALPGEPVETASPAPAPRVRSPRPAPRRPPGDQRRRRPPPMRRRERLRGEAVPAASPAFRQRAVTPPRRRLGVPEAAREFSFDR